MRMTGGARLIAAAWLLLATIAALPVRLYAQQTNKPVLHGRHWVAVTGTPLGAEAGAKIFRQGGNAVDAACAMLAATATMWDVLSWGGETQALIYNPNTGEVIGINALGVAPSGATPEYFEERGMEYPPAYGPLAAVTPGTPGGLMVMLAEYGTMSLEEVLQPAITMAAEGYALPEWTAESLRDSKDRIEDWKYSWQVFFGSDGEAPEAGSIFRQPDLAKTLRKLVEAEQRALADGATRTEAIYAAYDRFYTGDIAREFVRGAQEEGALVTMEDLANWEVKIEEPVHTGFHGYEVYKLTTWTQGPVMLQMLNMLDQFNLEAMGYNSARYIHTLYQVMNLAYADRDFYYGDPYVPPEEPIAGLLSEDYAAARVEQIDPDHNAESVKPGNPYLHQDGENPYVEYLEQWPEQFQEDEEEEEAVETSRVMETREQFVESFHRGTTSIVAADTSGWVVSVTPSGGWIPAVIAGDTGIGMSQRMQSFVTDPAENPYNVVQPGQRPRVTLTPGMALDEEGRPVFAFAVQGGDTQDQNLLQFFLNTVIWDMDVQEAAEAPNITSYQMHSSFGDHEASPGLLELNAQTPPYVRETLRQMGYELFFDNRTSGPINAIWIDHEHDTFWGGSSDYGSDYGIAW